MPPMCFPRLLGVDLALSGFENWIGELIEHKRNAREREVVVIHPENLAHLRRLMRICEEGAANYVPCKSSGTMISLEAILQREVLATN